MITQLDVLTEYHHVRAARLNDLGAPRAPPISALLSRLYEPSRIHGQMRFYTQRDDGIPADMISTIINGEPHITIVVRSNAFDLEDWQSEPSVYGWRWKTWPPQQEIDLIWPSFNEICAQCKYSGRCDYDYKERAQTLHNFWLENLLIQPTDDRNHGIFARNDISKSTVVGEDLAKLLLAVKDDSIVYSVGIAIGIYRKDPDKQIKARLDSTRVGSVMRFLNHSCEPNAQMFKGKLDRTEAYHLRRSPS